MNAKKIYALCSHGIPIDSGITRQLAEKLGTSPEVISNYARDGLTYRGQYSFEEVGLANERTAAAMKWAADWDRVRKKDIGNGEVTVWEM